VDQCAGYGDAVTFYPMGASEVNNRHAAAHSNAMPGIAYDEALNTTYAGASTVVYSMPESSRGKLLEGAGGFWPGHRSYDQNRQMDLIGINSLAPKDDACNYGASGSGASLLAARSTGPYDA